MFKKTTFKNGLRLVTVPLPGVETVAVLVLIGTGSRYEDEKTNGLAHFMEHMLFQGTRKYPSKMALALSVDKIGAEFNGMTDKEYTGYYVKAESRHFPLSADILSQMVCEPLIKEAEIEREKNVIVQEIAMREDMPQIKVADSLIELIFKGNPLGLSGAGEKKSVLTFKKNNFEDFRKNYYTGENTVIVVAGKFDDKDTEKLIEEKFSGLTFGEKKHFVGFSEKQDTLRKKIINKKTDQVHLAIGFPAYSRFSDKKYPQSLLDIILGSGMSSRLFQKIREEKSLAYYVGSEAENFLDTGLFTVYAGVDKKRVGEAVEAIWEELNKVTIYPSASLGAGKLQITNDELRKAKDYLRGKMVLRLEEALDNAMFYGVRELLEGKIETPKEVLEKVEKVKVGDVIETAQEIFKPEKSSLVIVGKE